MEDKRVSGERFKIYSQRGDKGIEEKVKRELIGRQSSNEERLIKCGYHKVKEV